MAIQIDAAINPGHNGGPAIMGNEVAGVALENLSGWVSSIHWLKL